MAQKFKFQDLKKLYGVRQQIEKGTEESENMTEEFILRNSATILQRLQKLSYLRGIRELNTRSSQNESQKSIAICLVIVDKLRHEEIWKEWIEQGNNENSLYKAELYIHAKYPERIQSDWVKSRTLTESFYPEWNSPEVIRAMLAVLEKALTNQLNGRFVFGTESCIPICNLQEIGDELFQQDVSWADAYHMPKDNYEQQYCFHAVNPSIIPAKYVWKALPGWIMITRRHAEELTKLPSLVDPDKKDLVIAWNTVHAPEEVYFSTMLALLGFLRDEPNATHTIHRNSDQNPFIKTTNDEVWRRRVCYAEWKRKNDANPIGFPALTVSLCNHFRRHGSIFARKFGENTITVDQWKEVISSAIPLSILKREQMSQSEGTLAPSTLEVNSPELDKNVLINSDIPISCQNSTIEVLVDDCPPMKKLKSSHDHDTVTDTTSISESPSPLE